MVEGWLPRKKGSHSFFESKILFTYLLLTIQMELSIFNLVKKQQKRYTNND